MILATPEVVAACIQRRAARIGVPLTEEEFARLIAACRAKKGFPGLEGEERRLERATCYRAANRARKRGKHPATR